MSDIFSGLRTGIKMPDSVWNSGPYPKQGRLPAPLHDTPDGRYNYNSALLGNITPYTTPGEGAYISTQVSYLNTPHKYQKIVPPVHLPEAMVGATDTFSISHPIDDADIAFTIRLNRNSVFCTGNKSRAQTRVGLNGIVDPMINLCTVNYLLSGFQIGVDPVAAGHCQWVEFLHNMCAHRFPKDRDYGASPINLGDLMFILRDCIRPLGIARGSERQGGQNEATMSAATWPVAFVTSITLDGKESNVLNVWHTKQIEAGNDLCLRMKLMPLQPYTLNHYDKQVVRKNWGIQGRFVWQLVPDIFHLDPTTLSDDPADFAATVAAEPRLRVMHILGGLKGVEHDTPWQALGYWHIGRCQISSPSYGQAEYWNNDLANVLKTNHLDMTVQPIFKCVTHVWDDVHASAYTGARLAKEPDPPRQFMLDAIEGGVFRDDPDMPGGGDEDLGSPMRGREDLGAQMRGHDDLTHVMPGSPASPGAQVEDEMPYELGPPDDAQEYSIFAETERQEREPLLDIMIDAGPDPDPAPEADPHVAEPLETSVVGLERPEPPPSPTYAPPPSADEVLHVPGLEAPVARRPKKKRVIEGSLLRADGTSEPSTATMLG